MIINFHCKMTINTIQHGQAGRKHFTPYNKT